MSASKDHRLEYSYPKFTLDLQLTGDQIDFFRKHGFIHFKRFISTDFLRTLLSDSRKFERIWLKEDESQVNCVSKNPKAESDFRRIARRFSRLNLLSRSFVRLIRNEKFRALSGLMKIPIREAGKKIVIINHYVNRFKTSYGQLGLHTDGFSDILYESRTMPMLTVVIHLSHCTTKKSRFKSDGSDKNEIPVSINPGDITVHDHRLWQRIQRSSSAYNPYWGSGIYVPVISGEFKSENQKKWPVLYQRLCVLVN